MATQKLTTGEKATQKAVSEKPLVKIYATKKKSNLAEKMLQQKIAQFGLELGQKSHCLFKQQDTDQLKIKLASSVTGHRYITAQYVKDWERKVERTGNINYPAIAAKKNFSGSLTTDVGITEDGSIYNICISRPSGYPELDEAVKRIVRMSAPFPALPSELLKELNVLVIRRKWNFSDPSSKTIP
jgi:protein TonB